MVMAAGAVAGGTPSPSVSLLRLALCCRDVHGEPAAFRDVLFVCIVLEEVMASMSTAGKGRGVDGRGGMSRRSIETRNWSPKASTCNSLSFPQPFQPHPDSEIGAHYVA
jgi:hypothetical protein